MDHAFVVADMDALDSNIIESLKVEKASKDWKDANAFSTVRGRFGSWGRASSTTEKTPASLVGKDPCKGGAMFVDWSVKLSKVGGNLGVWWLRELFAIYSWLRQRQDSHLVSPIFPHCLQWPLNCFVNVASAWSSASFLLSPSSLIIITQWFNRLNGLL